MVFTTVTRLVDDARLLDRQLQEAMGLSYFGADSTPENNRTYRTNSIFHV